MLVSFVVAVTLWKNRSMFGRVGGQLDAADQAQSGYEFSVPSLEDYPKAFEPG